MRRLNPENNLILRSVYASSTICKTIGFHLLATLILNIFYTVYKRFLPFANKSQSPKHMGIKLQCVSETIGNLIYHGQILGGQGILLYTEYVANIFPQAIVTHGMCRKHFKTSFS